MRTLKHLQTKCLKSSSQIHSNKGAEAPTFKGAEMILEPVGVEFMTVTEVEDLVQLCEDLEAFPFIVKSDSTKISSGVELLEYLQGDDLSDNYLNFYFSLMQEIIHTVLENHEDMWGLQDDNDTGGWLIVAIHDESMKHNLEVYKKYVANRNDEPAKVGALAVRTEERKEYQGSL